MKKKNLCISVTVRMIWGGIIFFLNHEIIASATEIEEPKGKKTLSRDPSLENLPNFEPSTVPPLKLVFPQENEGAPRPNPSLVRKNILPSDIKRQILNSVECEEVDDLKALLASPLIGHIIGKNCYMWYKNFFSELVQKAQEKQNPEVLKVVLEYAEKEGLPL